MNISYVGFEIDRNFERAMQALLHITSKRFKCKQKTVHLRNFENVCCFSRAVLSSQQYQRTASAKSSAVANHLRHGQYQKCLSNKNYRD
jgi:hypothetical protein